MGSLHRYPAMPVQLFPLADDALTLISRRLLHTSIVGTTSTPVVCQRTASNVADRGLPLLTTSRLTSLPPLALHVVAITATGGGQRTGTRRPSTMARTGELVPPSNPCLPRVCASPGHHPCQPLHPCRSPLSLSPLLSPSPSPSLTLCVAPPALKPPVRPSLRAIGIPDARDVLAVCTWWQRRRCVAASSQGDVSIASSVQSACGELEAEEHEGASSIEKILFETRSAAIDLLGVGAQFE